MSKPGCSFLLVILVSTGAAYNSSSSAQPGKEKPQGAPRVHRTTIDGKFAHYRRSPKGDIDGIVLDDGTIARFPPHAIASDTTELQPGDSIRVEGDAKNGPSERTFIHASVTKGNVVIVRAETPPPPPGGPGAGPGPHRGEKHFPNGELRTFEHPRAKLTAVSHEGEVAHILLSPRGDVDGLLLKDNTHIQLRPSAPNPRLVTGSKIRADGEGTASFVRTDKLTLVATGVVLEPSTPPGRRSAPRELATLEDSSIVLRVANNPEGEIDTLVLQDGAIVQLPPRLRDEAGDAIKVGTKLTVRGDGGTYDNVNALRADYVRLASGQVFTQPKRPSPPNPLAKKIGQEP